MSSTVRTVLVAGLLPQQASMIEQEFKGLLDLRFWKDGSISQLRYCARSADTTVMLSSMSSHRTRDVLKNNARHLVQCSGGMTNLKRTLGELS